MNFFVLRLKKLKLLTFLKNFINRLIDIIVEKYRCLNFYELFY